MPSSGIGVKLNTGKTNPIHATDEINYNSNTQKPNMSVGEAALYLGISQRKLRDLIAFREVRCCRIGRRIILRRVDLDAFLKSLATY
jgi:excisionase family DNA binding protein